MGDIHVWSLYMAFAFGAIIATAIVWPAARWDLRHRRAVRRAAAAQRAGLPIRTEPTVPGPVPAHIGVARHRATEPPVVELTDGDCDIVDIGAYRLNPANTSTVWQLPRVRDWKAGIDQAARHVDDVLRDMGPPPSGGRHG
jgi:hypothetical protein